LKVTLWIERQMAMKRKAGSKGHEEREREMRTRVSKKKKQT
jgi:hypothetical protein